MSVKHKIYIHRVSVCLIDASCLPRIRARAAAHLREMERRARYDARYEAETRMIYEQGERIRMAANDHPRFFQEQQPPLNIDYAEHVNGYMSERMHRLDYDRFRH